MFSISGRLSHLEGLNLIYVVLWERNGSKVWTLPKDRLGVNTGRMLSQGWFRGTGLPWMETLGAEWSLLPLVQWYWLGQRGPDGLNDFNSWQP